MRISLSQLGRWVDPSILRDADELAHRLTMVGLEVEEVVRFGQGHDDIITGRIEAIEEHPSADRLVICRVNVGDGELRQIVCGATNMKAGDVVPVALGSGNVLRVRALRYDCDSDAVLALVEPTGPAVGQQMALDRLQRTGRIAHGIAHRHADGFRPQIKAEDFPRCRDELERIGVVFGHGELACHNEAVL